MGVALMQAETDGQMRRRGHVNWLYRCKDSNKNENAVRETKARPGKARR